MHNCQKIHQVYLVKNSIKTLNLFFFNLLTACTSCKQITTKWFKFESETCNIDCMLKLLIHWKLIREQNRKEQNIRIFCYHTLLRKIANATPVKSLIPWTWNTPINKIANVTQIPITYCKWIDTGLIVLTIW